MLPYLQAYSAQAGMLGSGMHCLPVERGVRRHDVHRRHNRVAVPWEVALIKGLGEEVGDVMEGRHPLDIDDLVVSVLASRPRLSSAIFDLRQASALGTIVAAHASLHGELVHT